MARKLGLVGALAAVTLAGACIEPAPAPTAPAGSLPPPPTAPVDAEGEPIASLCDLLTESDFTEVAGITASEPEASGETETAATCRYGPDTQMVVDVAATGEEAAQIYDERVKGESFATVVRERPIGGVDESLHGTGAQTSGITLRREMLVVTIIVPGTDAQDEAILVQLAARVLDRSNALGT